MSEENKSHETSLEVASPEQKKIHTSENTQESNNYAGFWIRFLAYCVDIVVIYLIMLVVGLVIALFFIILVKASSVLAVIGAIFAYLFIIGLSIGYFIYFWANSGQTLGMRLVAIKVQKEDGQALGYLQAVVRYIGFTISAMVFYIGLIWVGFDQRKQGWHDKIASTVVIHTKDKSHKGIAILIGIIPFILFFVLMPIILSIILIALDPVSKFENENLTETNEAMTQEQADFLASEAFIQANKYRQEHGLAPVNEVQSICAYSQKRLKDFVANGKYDDGGGIMEDQKNAYINSVYFPNYEYSAELYFPTITSDTGASVVEGWIDKDSTKRTLLLKNYTDGCVRAVPGHLSFILASPK